jgi:hypothetical protein
MKKLLRIISVFSVVCISALADYSGRIAWLEGRVAALESATGGQTTTNAIARIATLEALGITVTNQIKIVQNYTSAWNTAGTDATAMTNWYAHGYSGTWTNDLGRTNVCTTDHGSISNVTRTP